MVAEITALRYTEGITEELMAEKLKMHPSFSNLEHKKEKTNILSILIQFIRV